MVYPIAYQVYSSRKFPPISSSSRLPGGSRPIDHILAEGGPDMWFEIDCGWIRRAAADPGAELARFKDRIGVIQTKDMAPPGTTPEDGWTATGDGIIDWAALVPLFRATRADHLVTETRQSGRLEAIFRTLYQPSAWIGAVAPPIRRPERGTGARRNAALTAIQA